MKARIAYEAYRDALHGRTRLWHIEKLEAIHKGRSDEGFDRWLRDNNKDSLQRYFMGDYDSMPAHSVAGWGAFAECVEHAEEGEVAEEMAWNQYVALNTSPN